MTGRPSLDGSVILVTEGRCGLNSSGSSQGPVAGSCEHGNEPSGFIKCAEFSDWLIGC
jgi:hypothetical protein